MDRRLSRLLLRLAGVAAAVALALALQALRPGPPSLGLTPAEVAAAWNAEAAPDLHIGTLEWTEPETGTFGFAFTPTVSLVGRTSGPEIVELVVVGDRSDSALVTEAADVLIAVVAPGTSSRSEVLEQLGLGGRYLPAQVEGGIVVDGVRLRSTSTTDRLGVGASPAA